MKIATMNIKRWLTAVLLVTGVIAGLGFIKYGQIQAAIAFAATFPEPSASVKSTYVATTEYAKTTKVIGQLQAPRFLTVSNEYAGPVTYVGFAPGDVVDKDQVLLQLDTSVEQANLNAAKARLKLANSTLDRLNRLLSQNRVSQDEVDKAEADVAISRAEVENLATIIDKKRIRAPFAGNVGLTQYQVGQLLDANTEITTLVGLNETIWVDFSVPQTLPQLDIGDEIEVALARSGAQTATNLRAKVIAKHPTVNINSRQQTYRAELPNTSGQLSHNQMVTVYVPIASGDAVVVPTNAVTRNHFGDFVYQLERDSNQDWRAKPVKVELGEKIRDQQIILSGLQPGDFIASEGAFKLRQDMLVYTQADPANASQAGGQQ